MNYLPIFVQIKQRPCLVVGGGSIAARKVALLRKAQGEVTVVSPELCDELNALLAEGKIQHKSKTFSAEDMDDCVIVIAATNQRDVNEQVSALANEKKLPVNVVDNPDLGSFIMPSIIDRSPVQIAISTGGASPVLARLIRTKLEGMIPAAYGRLGALVEGFRDKVKTNFPNVESRRSFWENILEGSVAELVFSGHLEKFYSQQLSVISSLLSEIPDLELNLDGYSDRQGDEAENMQLSVARLQSVRNYFVAHGIDGDRIKVNAYGEKNFVSSPGELAAYVFDRRVVVSFTSPSVNTGSNVAAIADKSSL